MLAAIAQHKPAILYLAYPNNPTGTLWDAGVIERLIESATLLGLDDEAAFHLQRYRVAYPKDHARWQKKNGASGEPLMPGQAPGVVVAPSSS